MRLKAEVAKSYADGLLNEKKHLTIEMKETKELLAIYENKTKQVMTELYSTSKELQ